LHVLPIFKSILRLIYTAKHHRDYIPLINEYTRFLYTFMHLITLRTLFVIIAKYGKKTHALQEKTGYINYGTYKINCGVYIECLSERMMKTLCTDTERLPTYLIIWKRKGSV